MVAFRKAFFAHMNLGFGDCLVHLCIREEHKPFVEHRSLYCLVFRSCEITKNQLYSMFYSKAISVTFIETAGARKIQTQHVPAPKDAEASLRRK